MNRGRFRIEHARRDRARQTPCKGAHLVEPRLRTQPAEPVRRILAARRWRRPDRRYRTPPRPHPPPRPHRPRRDPPPCPRPPCPHRPPPKPSSVAPTAVPAPSPPKPLLRGPHRRARTVPAETLPGHTDRRARIAPAEPLPGRAPPTASPATDPDSASAAPPPAGRCSNHASGECSAPFTCPPGDHAPELRARERDVQEPHRLGELLQPLDGLRPLVRVEVDDLPVTVRRPPVIHRVHRIPAPPRTARIPRERAEHHGELEALRSVHGEDPDELLVALDAKLDVVVGTVRVRAATVQPGGELGRGEPFARLRRLQQLGEVAHVGQPACTVAVAEEMRRAPPPLRAAATEPTRSPWTPSACASPPAARSRRSTPPRRHQGPAALVRRARAGRRRAPRAPSPPVPGRPAPTGGVQSVPPRGCGTRCRRRSRRCAPRVRATRRPSAVPARGCAPGPRRRRR